MRFKISRKTDVALQTLRFLAGRSQPASGADLAELTGTGMAYVSRCVKPLVDEGWVESRPGPEGGYLLAKSAHRLSLLQVVEAVEGPLVSSECVLDDRSCGLDRPCALHPMWAAAREDFKRSLARVKAINP